MTRILSLVSIVAISAVALASPSSAADEQKFNEQWVMLDGWNRHSSPVIADIDGDGENEVVIGHLDGLLRAYEGDGTPKWTSAAVPAPGPGCNGQSGPSSIDSSPTVADLDRDGVPEVIVGVGSAWSPDQNGSVIAFDGATGAIEWRTDDSRDTHDIWTQELVFDGWCEATFSTPAIGDVDGDGWDDVVFGSWDFYIWAVDRFGQPLPGFPFNNDDTVWSSPALFDIDGDGRQEIFIGGDSTPGGYYDQLGGVFRALDWSDGLVTELWNRPTTEVIMGSPAVADINGDGRPEAVVTPGENWHVTCTAAPSLCGPEGGSDHNKVFAFHLDDGSNVPGWPVSTGDSVLASPALGDVDGDGEVEVVVGSWDDHVYAWNGDGSVVWRRTTSHGADHLGPSDLTGHPIIADLDGDGDQDVAVGSRTGLALLDGRTGLSLESGDWRYRMGAGYSYENAPAVGILDGQRQIVFSGFRTGAQDTRIAAFPIGGSLDTEDAWPMFRANAERTGRHIAGICELRGCSNTFWDVPEGTWYTDAVEWMVAEGITTGVDPTRFAPSAELNRAQLITFLWRQAGEPVGYPAHGFVDVPGGSYFDEAVAWAAAEGITNGTGPGTFSPDQIVTRAQLVTLLWRRAGSPGGWSAPGFVDVAEGQFFTTPVWWAKATGVTNGTSATTFAPGDAVTRAQAAALIWREAGEPAI